MRDLDLIKEVVRQSSELSLRGQHREALNLLNAAISKDSWQNRMLAVTILSQHAAAISQHLGDLDAVRFYCEQILDCDPEHALAHYSLADALFRQGETELAKRHALKSYELVKDSDSSIADELLASIMQRWPEIGDWG